MHTTTGTRSTFNESRMGSPRVPNRMCPSTEAEQGMKKEFQTLSSKDSFSTWNYKNTRLHGKFFSVLLKRKQNKSIWTLGVHTPITAAISVCPKTPGFFTSLFTTQNSRFHFKTLMGSVLYSDHVCPHTHPIPHHKISFSCLFWLLSRLYTREQ